MTLKIFFYYFIFLLFHLYEIHRLKVFLNFNFDNNGFKIVKVIETNKLQSNYKERYIWIKSRKRKIFKYL